MTHPHDAALLNDLVDDRLTPAAADDLRRRIADEPALAAAHAELLRMRAAVAAMPVPVAVPSDFLARVRARAGLPPSVPAAAAAAPPVAAPPSVPSRAAAGAPTPGATPPDAGAGHDPGAGSGAPVVAERAPGRVLPFTRFAVPIAAGLGIVLGGGIYLATRFDRAPGSTSSARVAPSERTERGPAGEKRVAEGAGSARSRDDGTLDRSSGPPASANGSPGNWGPGETAPAAPGAGPTTGGAPAPIVAPPIAAGAAGGGDAPAPRFRAPGGAVPEGLRRPSDVPGAPPPPPSPTVAPPATGQPEPSRPAGVPPPTTPASPPPTTATTGRAPVAAEPAAAPAADATDDAEGASDDRPFGSRGARRGGAAKPGQPAPESLAAGLLRAEEGVDEVVVVRAASVDEARALLSVLTLRPADATARATGADVAYRGLDVVGPADALAKKAPASSDDKLRGTDADALGSFVAELSPAAYDALVASRDAAGAELHDADEPGAAYGRPGAAAKDAPPGADAPKAAAPEVPAEPAKPAGAGPAKAPEVGAGRDPAEGPEKGPEKDTDKGTDKGTEKGAAKAPVGGARGTPRGATSKGAPGAPAPTPAVPPVVPPSGEDEAPTVADARRAAPDASATVRRVRIVVLPR